MALNYTLTAATAVLTLTDNFDDTETCVVGGKTYTVNATVGATDGSVDLGTNAEGTLKNLAAAINLTPLLGETGVADADYASGMTINAEVYSDPLLLTATVLVVRARTPGTVGNLIVATETHGEGSWDNAVLSGGAGNIEGWVDSLLDLNQINAEVIQELLKLTPDAD